MADKTLIVRPAGPSRRLATASDEILLAAVQSARDAGRSWDFIGEALGIARQNAYRRFAHRLRTPAKTKRLLLSDDNALETYDN